ncbi:MAG: LysR family transcriptional regulator [Verrucomicrobia bacterium]|nr:LysR family transcriptional regulator [Verrucomicrobiota bacterium]
MEWLNYHHLRYFWAVAREGGLAPAAQKMHVSQSSLSEQIRELESSIGEKLFEKDGRRNRLTHAGKVVFNYADDIFSIGRELVQVVGQKKSNKALRLVVGVVDSVPKLVTNDIFRPVFAMSDPVRVTFLEGKIDDLVGELAMHRIDIILADVPAPSNPNLKLFSHALGETSTTICVSKKLVPDTEVAFPQVLSSLPALLPTEGTPLRQSLDFWFHEIGMDPMVAAEFDDLALMKVMASDGCGYIAIPSVCVNEAMSHYNLRILGEIPNSHNAYYVITAQRKLINPAVRLVTESAQKNIFTESKIKKTRKVKK